MATPAPVNEVEAGSSPDVGLAGDFEANEQTPLVENNSVSRGSLREGVHMDQIPPNCSIYNSIIFIPPMARHRHGSYWTREVCLAFMLVFITCLLQGGLTLIVGRDILANYDKWVSTLVEDASNVNFDDWDTFHARHHLEASSKYIWDGAEWIVKGNSSKDAVGCCHGPECAVVDAPCCPPIPQAASRARRASLLAERKRRNPLVLSAKKPSSGGKGDKSGGDEQSTQRSAAICTRQRNGDLNCAPPSAAFLDHWDELDYDGDGVWTVEEARDDLANLACRLAVPTMDVFQNAVHGLVMDARDTARLRLREEKIPEIIETSKGIPFAYFQWWQGIAALCVTTDAAYCGQLVGRGLFDGALDPASKGGRGAVTNLDSAMSYCGRLLTPGGICDRALSGTYTLYRDRIHEKCGAGSYTQGHRYINPFNEHDVIGTINVNYELYSEYLSTHGHSFLVFMFFILFLWYSNLVDEFKDILLLLDFVMNFPVDRNIDSLPVTVSKRLRSTFKWSTEEHDLRDVVETHFDDGSKKVEIRRISLAHWQMCSLMVVVRAVMLVYMCYAGTFFLLSNHTFIDLLLNSVALAFIFELDEFLFAFLVSEETKRDLEDCEPLHFRSSFPQHGQKAGLYKKGNWGLVIIPALCVLVVIWNDVENTVPVLRALECACFAQGKQCTDSQIFSDKWWHQYWADTSKLAM